MKMSKHIKLYLIYTVTLVSFLANAQSKFKVTLDAGHGDHDSGAHYNGRVEKNITLAVVLKVGAILDNDPNIAVNYTRKTDVFIDLVERANIANRVKANIFVSIHCNANKNTAADGTETYVMGLSKSASSIAVAKSENEVVTLEKNYKQKYNGFDPNSPESIIGTTLMQEEFLENSIALASKVQEGFLAIGKKSRADGVKQAPFMVLHKASMPRILIEMGFISNDVEGDLLNSEEGQNQVAQSIAKAIISYKKEYFGDGSIDIDEPTEAEKKKIRDSQAVTKTTISSKSSEIIKSDLTYKIQISASTKTIRTVPKNFKGLNDISATKEGKTNKYFYGNTSNYDQIKLQLNEAKAKGYKSAFIVTYKNGMKI
jgi:N-acetylmuramoyl-L-alanine amidase